MWSVFPNHHILLINDVLVIKELTFCPMKPPVYFIILEKLLLTKLKVKLARC